MRRHALGQFCAALLLIWFAVLTGAPSALHACPVHDPSFATAPDAQHNAHSHQTPQGGDHQACSCIGDCIANSVPPALPAGGEAFVVARTCVLEAPIQAPDSPAVTSPAFVLPYANGPPGSLRVA
jgi:hypothetical protein